MTATPTSTLDLFTDSDPEVRYRQYRELRAIGAVVHLDEPDAYVVTRYDEVKAALGDHERFVSSQGVGLNPIVNSFAQGNTITTDPPEHEVLRGVVAEKLQPREVRSQRERVTGIARGLVERVVGAGEIDGVTDFAQAMPMAVIPDFLGFPERNREHLYEWTKGALDLHGPDNERTPHNLELLGCIGGFAEELATNRELAPGSLGAAVLDAADQGVISADKCPLLMVDYLGPSLETTATAIGHTLVLFARHPEQWTQLREEPALVSSAINEVLRMESPFRGFARVAAQDVELGGVTIPRGARVWPLNASANRDERKWERSEEFDFRRNPLDHLAFGYGVHGCAGQGMARLELHALIHALLESVERIELVGEPEFTPHTWVNTHDRIPVRLIPSGG